MNGDGRTDAAIVDDLGNITILLGFETGAAYHLNAAVSPANSGTIAISQTAAGNNYVFGTTGLPDCYSGRGSDIRGMDGYL